MRVAILETVKTNGGFEQEFDRLIIDELKCQGHEPLLLLPENSSLSVDFDVPIEYLQGGSIISYEGAGKLKKRWLSLQREARRIRWFNSAYERAARREFDAIILTTATYRYLRSLHKSKLKESPIPVIFIFLGVNPQEKPKFLVQAERCKDYKNIRLKVTSLRNDFLQDNVSNVEVIQPPVLRPAGVSAASHLTYREPIRIGFFGHYRQGEKNIDKIIQAFVQAELDGLAHLVVQLAPTESADIASASAIMKKYDNEANVSFIKSKLYGKEWYDALSAVDVLFLPYQDKRYVYNWSAVYFNAMALCKPVLTTAVLNPEVLARYKIGEAIQLDDLQVLSEQIHEFIYTYREKLPIYEANLFNVNQEFSAANFLKALLK